MVAAPVVRSVADCNSDLLEKGGIMCTRKDIALVAGFVLALTGFFPAPSEAQVGQPRPPVQDVQVKPIGKVVVATGSVSIERTSAVVVQANVAGQTGET